MATRSPAAHTSVRVPAGPPGLVQRRSGMRSERPNREVRWLPEIPGEPTTVTTIQTLTLRCCSHRSGSARSLTKPKAPTTPPKLVLAEPHPAEPRK